MVSVAWTSTRDLKNIRFNLPIPEPFPLYLVDNFLFELKLSYLFLKYVVYFGPKINFYWLIWHKCQRAYTIMNFPSCVVGIQYHLVSSWWSVDSPPGYKLNHRNLIFCTCMHMCPRVYAMKYQVNMIYVLNGSHFPFHCNCFSSLYGWS